MLVEVYEYIDSVLDDGKYIFYEKDLRLMYKQRTLQFSIDVTINEVNLDKKWMTLNLIGSST